MKPKKTYIAVYAGECSVQDSIEEAMQDLKENCTHEPEFEDILFYEAKLLSAKQVIVIEDEKENSDKSDTPIF